MQTYANRVCLFFFRFSIASRFIKQVNLVIQDDMGSTASAGLGLGSFRGGTAANLRKALFAQHLGLKKEKFEDVFDNLRKDRESKSCPFFLCSKGH